MTDSPTLHTHDRKEFHYEVDGDDGEPFAKMTLFGDGKISNHMATYTAGEQLRGKVTMKLNKPVSLQHVTLKVSAPHVYSKPIMLILDFLLFILCRFKDNSLLVQEKQNICPSSPSNTISGRTIWAIHRVPQLLFSPFLTARTSNRPHHPVRKFKLSLSQTLSRTRPPTYSKSYTSTPNLRSNSLQVNIRGRSRLASQRKSKLKLHLRQEARPST